MTEITSKDDQNEVIEIRDYVPSKEENKKTFQEGSVNTSDKFQHISTLSVSEALRCKDGQAKVRGIIVSKTQIHKDWTKLGNGPSDLRPTVEIEICQIPYNQSREFLKVILHDDLLDNIKLGRAVTITGKIHCIRLSKRGNYVNILTAKDLAYDQNSVINDSSKMDFDKSKEIPKSNATDKVTKLLSYFNPHLIGLQNAKVWILLTIVNSTCDEISKEGKVDDRIHTVLIGNTPNISILLSSIHEIAPNSIHTNLMTSTATLAADELKDNGSKKLRVGAASLGSNILEIENIGKIRENQIPYIEELIKYGKITIDSDNFKEVIPANASVIASNGEHTTSSITNHLISQFDIMCDCKNEPPESSVEKSPVLKNTVENNTELLRNYLAHARTLNPELNREASQSIINYAQNGGKMGNQLVKITKGIARLKLKVIADNDDVSDSIGLVVSSHNEASNTSEKIELKDEIVQQCINILKENGSSLKFTDIVEKACENENTDRFLGKKRQIYNNSKVRNIKDRLKQHPLIRVTNEKPTEFALKS